jgi:urease accessory protein
MATRTATTTTITTITIMADPATLRLLSWLSPAFPTGGFAYSHGLEWAIEAGDVTNQPTLHDWLETLLHHGSGRTDAILARHAHRAAHNLETLAHLTELALATAPAAERRAEAIHQGNAFIAAATPWHPETLKALAATTDVPYAIAVGAMAGSNGIDETTTAQALLHAFTANLISAAVRIIPLGQSTGLAVLAALEPVILQVAEQTETATLDDLGTATWRADLAAMRHETQYTRLFRS